MREKVLQIAESERIGAALGILLSGAGIYLSLPGIGSLPLTLIIAGFAAIAVPRLISLRKRANAAKNPGSDHSLQEAVQKLYMEKKLLTDQIDDLAAVREVSLAVGAILDFTDMIRAILDLVTTHYGISKALIYLQCEDEKWYEIVGARAKGRDISPSRVLQKRIRIGDGLVGRAAFERKEIVECREGKGVVAAIPLTAKSRVVGILKLFDADVSSLTPERCRKLHAVAGAIGMALENSRLYRMAVTDHLTGLYVRRHFEQRLEDEFKRALRYRSPLSLLIIDIDHFKKVNDTYGHPVGDLVIRKTAGLIMEEARGTDIPCRYGGEEIAVICPETDLEGAKKIASRIRERIESFEFRHSDGENGSLKATVSIGVAAACADMAHRKDLITRSDEALYRAKQTGRNRVVTAEELDAKVA